MKKVILIDVDGVIANFVDAFMYLYRFHGGEVPDDFVWNDWDSMDTLPDQMARENVWRDRDLFWTPKPYDGAIDALMALNDKFDVRIVTAVPHIHVQTRSEWFKMYASFIHGKKQMIFTSDKSLIRGDYFVDDYLPHVRDWISVNLNPAYLVGRPWNKETVRSSPYYKVSSLAMVATILGA